MAMSSMNFTQKINWRMVAIHIAAIFFLVMSAKQLAILNDPVLLDTLGKYGVDEGLNQFKKADDFMGRLTYFNAWIILSASIGILMGLILSASIIVKRKLHWLNIVVVIIAVIIIGQSGLYQNAFIVRIINLLGYVVRHAELKYRYILTGTIPLLISLLLFFNKRINNGTNSQQPSVASSSIPAHGLV